MKLSFYIASIDRKEALKECIKSIEHAYEHASGVSIEIIVVFSGPNSCYNDFIKAKYPGYVSFHHITELAQSRARNYAIGKSTGDYIAFIDDDATINRDYLTILARNIISDNANVFFGRLLNPLDNTPFTAVYNDIKSRYLGYFDYYHSGGTTMAIKKNTVVQAGLFDERFGESAPYYAAEESDLYFRLLQMGEKLLYLPDLVVFHPVVQETYPVKAFNYSYSIGAMIMKQLLIDWRHSYFYLAILGDRLFRSFFRLLQFVILPNTLVKKDKRFRYAAVFWGTLYGFIAYLVKEQLIVRFNIKSLFGK